MLVQHMLLDVIIAYLIDLIVGDPYWLPHPVRFIGWLVKTAENFFRGLVSKARHDNADRTKAERLAGTAMALYVIITTFLLVYIILIAAGMVHSVLFHVLNIYFIYSALATKCLGDEALKVYKALAHEGIAEARKRLAMLVGRQTEHLNDEEIIRGVVETTAENTVDGIISPLTYAILGSFFGIGAPLAYAFKAASTLDSMVGYMNDKYINFGRSSAKIDDAANYIPARLSGIIIPLSAMICGKNFQKSFLIMLRDRRNHKSPNCAYPESAVAGALGVRLGGANVYFGQVVEKPTIGDADKELEDADIKDAVKIMYVASLVTLALLVSAAFIALSF